MEELWERAVESAIDGRTSDSPIRTLTLDGAVTCFNGRLPPPILFEKFQTLEHLSIANVGLTSLEMFPRLWNLQKLVLSDNRISGGLEFLVQAGLRSLRDLDLSNNRIENVEDLLPLAQLELVSLDLYECPVTRVSDYRVKIFGLIKSLKCLDKLEADEDDGEVDGVSVDLGKSSNGSGAGTSGVDIHENEESDEDGVDEERDELRVVNLSNGALNGNVNGYRVNGEDEDGDDHDYSEESEGVDEGVEEVQEIEDIVEEEEGVENEGSDNDEYENEEEVEHVVPESSRAVIHSRAVIDGHEEGEEDSDNDGEYEEDGEEDEELGVRVRPVGQAEDNGEASDLDPLNVVDDAEEIDGEASDLDPLNEIDDGDDAEEIHDEYPNTEFHLQPSSSSQTHLKRKRPEEQGSENDEDDENDSVQDG